MDQRNVRVFVVLAAGLALGACSIDLSAEKLVRREDRRYTVAGTPEVVLKTFDGAIQVQSWDKPEVLVTIERHAGNEDALQSITVKAAQDGNRITVEVPRPEGTGGFAIGPHTGRSAALLVTVPRQAHVNASSGDGAVTVEQVSGNLQVDTGDGAVGARGTRGTLVIHTGDGGVALENVEGQVELTTGDGGVTIDGRLQGLKARTGDGGISVRAASGSAAASDWQLETGDGAITLEIPEAFSAELDARSNDGRVSVEGLEVGGDGRRETREVRGRLGTGGNRVVIRTGDGSITVRKG